MNQPRTPKRPLQLKACVRCKTNFAPYREWQRYCTPRCRNLHYWETHEVIKTDIGDQVIPVQPSQ